LSLCLEINIIKCLIHSLSS